MAPGARKFYTGPAMRVGQKHYQTIWIHPQKPGTVCVIDQRRLPHEFVIGELRTLEDACRAIGDMQVRGAPLIGVTAAFGMYLAALAAPGTENFDAWLQKAAERLIATRPTAVNLAWAVRRQLEIFQQNKTPAALLDGARRMAEEDIETCRKIGGFGLALIEGVYRKKKASVNILTHCNAGWLACVDWGTATAPIYQAFEAGLPVHVWVDETRPRNQGASLTAWELGEHGVPYTLIADNAGGHLMQHGQVDLVLVGTDRTTRCGDVANKIGTYLKALAAHDNGVPFYAAVPSSSIDWGIRSGLDEIPIEERGADEVKYMRGLTDDGRLERVLIAPGSAKISNFGFDVTPARLISGLITERGVCNASEEALLSLFPEKKIP